MSECVNVLWLMPSLCFFANISVMCKNSLIVALTHRQIFHHLYRKKAKAARSQLICADPVLLYCQTTVRL